MSFYVIGFSLLILLLTGAVIYRLYRMRQAEQQLEWIKEELNSFLKKVIEEKDLYKKISRFGTGHSDLLDPAMLSSLITVMINKYGPMNLSVQDFYNVSEEDYISVYVDINTQDIILSTNHDLEAAGETVDPSSMIKFSKTDDNTFH